MKNRENNRVKKIMVSDAMIRAAHGKSVTVALEVVAAAAKSTAASPPLVQVIA